MAASTPDPLKKLVAAFLGGQRIVIADTASSSRAGIAKTLCDLGARMEKITLAGNYEQAVAELDTKSPGVVVTDFTLGKRHGLELLQSQRASNPKWREALFVVVTSNTSQSAVAQSAEEDVDAYIIKPYTLDVFRQVLSKAIIIKVKPSDYLKAIETGKAALASGNLDGAVTEFEKAVALDPKPSLALYYSGATHLKKQVQDTAESKFLKGLDFNKIHYRCMVGLFDLLIERKHHKEAYELVKKITRYFPANPDRLSQVLKLAIITQNFDDIERYYQNFIDLDERHDELVRHVCAALVVCGKHYLSQRVPSRAVSLFQKAAITGVGRTKLLREIIIALTEHELINEAQEILRRFPPDTQREPEYLAMEFLVGQSAASPEIAVSNGRKLLTSGVHDPAVYRFLIKAAAKANAKGDLERLLEEAKKRWPAQSAEWDLLTQALG